MEAAKNNMAAVRVVFADVRTSLRKPVGTASQCVPGKTTKCDAAILMLQLSKKRLRK